MDELEISKTLPQLTPKQARARTEQNKKIGAMGPISLYMHVLQGGIQAENTTLPRYCAEVYGVDVRTGQYWMTRVRAMMILNEISEERLLQILTGGEIFPELPPTDVSTQIVKSEPAKARLAWERFQAIRDAPTLTTKGNGASFKRLLGSSENTSRGEMVSPLRDQKTSKTVISTPTAEPPKPPANTINPGPYCECGEPCAEGHKFCAECLKTLSPMIFGKAKCEECGTPIKTGTRCENCKDFKPKILTETVSVESNASSIKEPVRIIKYLHICSVEKHPSEFHTVIRATSTDGMEYVLRLEQKMWDLAPEV